MNIRSVEKSLMEEFKAEAGKKGLTLRDWVLQTLGVAVGRRTAVEEVPVISSDEAPEFTAKQEEVKLSGKKPYEKFWPPQGDFEQDGVKYVQNPNPDWNEVYAKIRPK